MLLLLFLNGISANGSVRGILNFLFFFFLTYIVPSGVSHVLCHTLTYLLGSYILSENSIYEALRLHCVSDPDLKCLKLHLPCTHFLFFFFFLPKLHKHAEEQAACCCKCEGNYATATFSQCTEPKTCPADGESALGPGRPAEQTSQGMTSSFFFFPLPY